MSIPTPACNPATRPDPSHGPPPPLEPAGLWIAPAVWKTRTRRSELIAPPSKARFPHRLGRPRTPPVRSTGKIVVLSDNDVTELDLERPLRNRWEETDRGTSLCSDERSRSPECVFTFTGFGVQLHRNAHVPRKQLW